MLLEIHVETTTDNIPVIHLKGEIDLHSCEGFRNQLRDLIAERHQYIVVDLAQVPYLDSAALGVLVDAVRRVNEVGGAIHLAATTPFVRRAFEITRLAKIFELDASVDSSLDAIRSKPAPGTAEAVTV
jgi:anti-anti-sigma factor